LELEIAMTEYERNAEVARSIRRDFCWNGRSFNRGEFVGLLDGEVVVVAPTLADALEELESIDPSPDRGMLVKVAPPVVDVIR